MDLKRGSYAAYILSTALAFAVCSCAKRTVPQDQSANSNGGKSGASATGESGSKSSDLSAAKVDGSKLTVTRVVISDFQNSDKLQHSLSYEVIGRPQYVEYWVIPCSDTTDCSIKAPPAECSPPKCYSQRTSLLRARIPTLWPGRVRLMLHACVEANFSTTAQNCGPINSSYFEQTHYNQAAADALLEKVRLVDAMGNAMLDVRGIMKKFNDDVQACEAQVGAAKEMLDAKTAFVRVVLGVPYQTFTEQGRKLADSILQPLGSSYEAAAAGMEDIKDKVSQSAHDAMKNVCIALDQSRGVDYETAKGMTAGNITCKIAEVIPHMIVEFLFMPLNFSKPFGVLSDVFVKISAAIDGNAGSIVPKNCTAEQDLNLSLSATKTQMDEISSQLQALRKTLISLGLLVASE